MMVMTAKVDKKKIILVLLGLVALVLALTALFGGSEEAPAPQPTASDNDFRVQFLSGHGWTVHASPKESGQVRIPENQSQAYERYNALQKSQGYDLSPYAGKTVMRYVYSVTNYEGATDPVYATLLVYKNQIIGGDITNTSPRGVIQGFRKPAVPAPAPSAPAPTEATTPEPAETTVSGPTE